MISLRNGTDARCTIEIFCCAGAYVTAAEVLVARGRAATRVQRHTRGWLARRR